MRAEGSSAGVHGRRRRLTRETGRGRTWPGCTRPGPQNTSECSRVTAGLKPAGDKRWWHFLGSRVRGTVSGPAHPPVLPSTYKDSGQERASPLLLWESQQAALCSLDVSCPSAHRDQGQQGGSRPAPTPLPGVTVSPIYWGPQKSALSPGQPLPTPGRQKQGDCKSNCAPKDAPLPCHCHRGQESVPETPRQARSPRQHLRRGPCPFLTSQLSVTLTPCPSSSMQTEANGPPQGWPELSPQNVHETKMPNRCRVASPLPPLSCALFTAGPR